MALSAGSVTVADDGTHTGSGLALARYEAELATLSLPPLPVLGNMAAPYAPGRPVQQSDIDAVKEAILTTKRAIARRATAWSAADIAYFLANNGVTVSTAVGRLPDPPIAGAALEPLASPAVLQVT